MAGNVRGGGTTGGGAASVSAAAAAVGSAEARFPRPEMIKPKKPLTWLSGHYGFYSLNPEIFLDEEEAPWNYCKLISSLKFGNNEEVYGPFGYEGGTPFIFKATT